MDWVGIDDRLGPVAKAARALGDPIRTGDSEALAEVIRANPRCLDAMLLLLGHTPKRMSFSDDAKSIDLDVDHERVQYEEDRAKEIAEVYLETGVGRHLRMVQSTEDVLLGVLLGLQPNRRKNARGTVFERAVANVLDSAVRSCSASSSSELTVASQAKVLDKRVDYLVTSGGRPFLAVEGNFYTGSGSKPSEVLERAYPELQRDLGTAAVSLAVVTDGAGWHKMTRVLERSFQKLENLMNLRQAASGGLVKILSSSLRSRA